LTDTAGFISAFRDFYETAKRQGMAVAIGGRALAEEIRCADRTPLTGMVWLISPLSRARFTRGRNAGVAAVHPSGDDAHATQLLSQHQAFAITKVSDHPMGIQDMVDEARLLESRASNLGDAAYGITPEPSPPATAVKGHLPPFSRIGKQLQSPDYGYQAPLENEHVSLDHHNGHLGRRIVAHAPALLRSGDRRAETSCSLSEALGGRGRPSTRL
jgi:hypothetical protein